MIVNNGPMTFNPQEPPLYVAAQSMTFVVEPSFTAITMPAGGTMTWADNGTVQWSGTNLRSFGRLTVIWPDDSEHVSASQPSGDGTTMTYTNIQTDKPPAPGVVRFRFENQSNNCFAEADSVPSLTLT